jgi:serine/threonine protein kinase
MRITTDGFSSAAEGRFESLKRIGAGGMGDVYGAVDTWTRRPVALKMARQRRGEKRRANDQLLHEAIALWLVSDRHVCAIHDVAYDDGRVCLVLERLVGESLQARLTRGNISNSELLDVAIQTASALEAIHAAGVVHQDIKPANIFLTRSGVVKVLDFGIAVAAGDPSEGAIADGSGSRPAAVLGSSNYISPERLLRRPADPRGDLFSLGVVVYEMATGVRPFAADTPSETLLNVIDARPVPVRELAPERPAALAALAHSLLARRAKDRCQSAGEVVKQLRALRRVDAAAARRVPAAVAARGRVSDSRARRIAA